MVHSNEGGGLSSRGPPKNEKCTVKEQSGIVASRATLCGGGAPLEGGLKTGPDNKGVCGVCDKLQVCWGLIFERAARE